MAQQHDGRLSRRTVLKGGAAAALFAAGARPAKAAHGGRAKSVIQIWMWGGPAHIDTFDPKPEAGYDYCGPLDKAIGTNVDGIRINAALPKLAQHADKYAIIRSMTHGINAHETASYRVQTGREPGRLVFPSAGAVVSLFKGYEAGYAGAAPPYIVLTTPQGRFSEAGFLGQRYKPFATGGDPNQDPFAVTGIVAEGISDERQLARRGFLRKLDTLGQAMPGVPAVERFNACENAAYDMMFGPVRDLFNLSLEEDPMREAYGRNTFGQACLAARRLVESGVPYVTINYQGWDTHKRHFQEMQRKLPELDQGMSALLADLSDRGLLDTTIVWWGGEFGRSPKVGWEPPWNGGRTHFGACFSTVLAGGGFKGGQVLGASDDKGESVAERPVDPREVLAAVYTQMGIDPHGPLPNDAGVDTPVLPPAPKDAPGGGRLSELT